MIPAARIYAAQDALENARATAKKTRALARFLDTDSDMVNDEDLTCLSEVLRDQLGELLTQIDIAQNEIMFTLHPQLEGQDRGEGEIGGAR
jgi:hypothetical protein